MGLNFFGFWGSLGRRLVCLFVCFCFFEGLFFNFANFIVLGRFPWLLVVVYLFLNGMTIMSPCSLKFVFD